MPIPQPPSLITAGPPQVDPPVVQDTNYKMSDVDRAYLDSQIRGCELHLVQSLVGGTVCTWVQLDPGSAAVASGNTVCLTGSANGTVTLATSPAIANAGKVFGVCMGPASPGAWMRVAVGGILPSAITGIQSGPSYAVSNGGNTVSSNVLGPAFALVGLIDGAGNIALSLEPPIYPGGLASMATFPVTGIVFPADSNQVALSLVGQINLILVVTSSLPLTGTRNLQLPLINGAVVFVTNSTTGAQSITFIGVTGTGVTVANGKRDILTCDGVNWNAQTAAN